MLKLCKLVLGFCKIFKAKTERTQINTGRKKFEQIVLKRNEVFK